VVVELEEEDEKRVDGGRGCTVAARNRTKIQHDFLDG
jgi:hypothetical protein